MSSPTAIQTASSWRRLAAGALGLLVSAGSALAHDFWIEPSSLAPASGQVVTVRLLVGERFSGDAVTRPPAESLHAFVVADANSGQRATLPGRPGAEPAGTLRLVKPGHYILGFHGKHNEVELPADKFNAYLAAEGLDAVLAWRAENGQAARAGREIYSRCAKSLLQSGAAGTPGAIGATDGPGQQVDRALGFTLELIAERRPDALRAGQALPVRLLFEGQPLAGALVVALHRADPTRSIALRSDAQGRVALPLDRAGHWLVKAVHMRRAPAGSGADWESWWASLTFQGGAEP